MNDSMKWRRRPAVAVAICGASLAALMWSILAMHGVKPSVELALLISVCAGVPAGIVAKLWQHPPPNSR